MKIKRKVQKNLPQLIEWAQDNIEEATKKVYRVNENEVLGDHVRFTEVYSDLEVRLHGYIPFDTTFTVEVEEVVDEDTVFNYLLLTYKKDNDKIETHWYEDKCKKSVLSQSDSLMYVSEQLSITYFDDKGIPHLIWTHEKGMVE